MAVIGDIAPPTTGRVQQQPRVTLPDITFEEEEEQEEEALEDSRLIASAEETPVESPPVRTETAEAALPEIAQAEITREASPGGRTAMIIGVTIIAAVALGVGGFLLYKKRRVAA